MKINKINIENYRNIEKIDAEFENVNIIWGENAQGKTNLLEAIYLFTGSKSFRGVKDSQLVKFNEEKSNIKIEFESNNRLQNAEIAIDSRRKAILNGIAKKSTSQLGDEIKAVIFSPVHLSMIKDGPIERRKFIDTALCQIKSNYRNLLKDYNKALLQRNALLKNGKYDNNFDSSLYIWNINLAGIGAKIIYQRLKYLEAVNPYVKDIFLGISNGTEDIELKYSGADDYTTDIRDIENKLLTAIESSKEQDIINKTTTKGPHRDDIDIFINNISAKTFGSQGQQRSCVLAIKLAEASLLKEMTGVEPIALLDDVMSELDEKRQDYILNHIKDWQVFITCCEKETILRLKQGKTFHIDKGRLV